MSTYYVLGSVLSFSCILSHVNLTNSTPRQIVLFTKKEHRPGDLHSQGHTARKQLSQDVWFQNVCY